MTTGFKLDSKTVVSIARLVLIGIGFVAVALMVDVPDSTDSYDQYAAEVARLRHEGRRQLIINDSLRKVDEERRQQIQQSNRRVAVLNNELARLRGHTEGLEEEADSLKRTLTDSVALAREVIPRQERIIENKNEEIRKQGLIITEHEFTIGLRDSSILDLRQSNDSLSGIIRRMQPAPANPNKLFGIIPMPSRTTTLVIGVGAGAAAATALILSAR